MPEFAPKREKFALIAQRLAVSVISDILDTLGLRDQFMRPKIWPLDPEALVVGWAMSLLYAEVFEVPEKPSQMEVEAVDSLKPDDVLVAYLPITAKAPLWGSILSPAAKALGVRAIVIEGMTRDVQQSTNMAFPVFATRMSPLDAEGRLRLFAYRCAIECGGVLVEPGDILLSDANGVGVIP